MPTQPRNLVTEDEDPDCQMGDGASLQTEKLEHPDEGKTDKDNATVHCPLSTVTGQGCVSQLSCSGLLYDVFGFAGSRRL